MHKNQIAKKRNYLERVKKVLEIYRQHKQYDTPNTVIWKKHVYPTYHISLSQFNHYLTINLHHEQKQLNDYEAFNKEKTN